MSTENEGFGKASLERDFEGYKRFKLVTPDQKKGEEKTELILRLLPSMKSYRDTGTWKFFHGLHFGYEGTNPRDPQKGRARPFACIQKKDRNKQVTDHCPKCDQMEKVRAKVEAREVALAAEKGIEDRKSKEFTEVKRADQKLKVLNDWLRKHNCDRKFHINAMSPSGECGVLTLSYTVVTDKLEPLLKELRDKYKIDAFDPTKGLWLKFTRTGQAPRVNDNVEVLMEEGADGSFRRAFAPMTTEQIQKALRVCPDLSNVKQEIVRKLPVEAIQALVDCDGSKEAVDAIWSPFDKDLEAAKKATAPAPAPKQETAEVEDDVVVEDEPVQDVTSAPQMPASASSVATPVEAAQDADDAEEAALKAQMAALLARKSAKKPVEKPKAPVAEDTGMGMPNNPDDFLDLFEAK